jgi:hypothetical protein
MEKHRMDTRKPESPVHRDYASDHERLKEILGKHVNLETGKVPEAAETEEEPQDPPLTPEEEQLEDLRRAQERERMDAEALQDPDNVPKLPQSRRKKLH